jgi:hypothetical protein
MTVAGTRNQSARRAPLAAGRNWGDLENVEDKRAPDPFRPGDIPKGKPFAKAGRPGTAVLVVVLIVAVLIGLIVWASLR